MSDYSVVGKKGSLRSWGEVEDRGGRGGREGGRGTIISYRINSHLAEVLIVGLCEIKFPHNWYGWTW